jgi:tetratricopeptide (TPR) repeat protein
MSTAHFPRLRDILPAVFLLSSLSTPTRAADPPRRPRAEAPVSPSDVPPSDMPTGDGLSKWHVDDADPMKSIPTDDQRDHDPLQFGYHLMDLAEKGGAAAKKGDHRSAVKYYAALAKAVPDRSIAFTKMCTSYEALGAWEKATEACRTALGLPGVTVADSSHFVRLMLTKRAKLTPAEVDDVTAVIDHLREDESTRQLATDLQCEVGARIEDTQRLEECAAALAAVAPDDARTISYQWALALNRKDFAQARDVIAHAKNTAMPPQGIQHMEEVTRAAEPMWRKALRDWRVPAGAAGVVAAAAIALVVSRRRSPIVAGS